MKTKELIKLVEEFDFVGRVVENEVYLSIKNKYNETFVSIEKKKRYSFDKFSLVYNGLSDEQKEQLMSIVIPYISTPTEERKDEKRYYVRSKFDNSDYNHLNLSDLGHTYIGNKLESLENQTKFTIDKLKELGIQFDENDEPYEWTLKEVAE